MGEGNGRADSRSRFQTGLATLHVLRCANTRHRQAHRVDRQGATPGTGTGTGTPVAWRHCVAQRLATLRPCNNSRRRSEICSQLWPSIRGARNISRKEQSSYCSPRGFNPWHGLRKGRRRSLALALHAYGFLIPWVVVWPGIVHRRRCWSRESMDGSTIDRTVSRCVGVETGGVARTCCGRGGFRRDANECGEAQLPAIKPGVAGARQRRERTAWINGARCVAVTGKWRATSSLLAPS
jgi:hypothetical protein